MLSEAAEVIVVSGKVAELSAVLLSQEQSTTVVANKDVSKTVSFLPVYFMWDFLSAGYIFIYSFYYLTILYQFMRENTITFQLQLYYSLEKQKQPAYPNDTQAVKNTHFYMLMIKFIVPNEKHTGMTREFLIVSRLMSL